MSPSRIALFIDFDNAQLAALEMGLLHCRSSQLWVSPLVREIERVVGGSVEIRRCYGNVLLNAGRVFTERVFRTNELRDRIAVDVGLQMDLLNNGFQMIHTPSASGKNRADILMAIDCMEIAAKYEQIDSIAILSHDSDFSPLIHKLRALGKGVAWVTVGEIPPEVRGRRSMESMATHRVIFDQKVVDRAGHDIFSRVVEELQKDPANPLKSGVALPTIEARMTQREADFSYEDLGFTKFRDFVDASLEAPLELGPGGLRSKARTPLPAPAPQKPPAAAEPPATRDREFFSCLGRKSLRPLPGLRRKITRWLHAEVFDTAGKPRQEGLTFGLLEDLVVGQFCPQEASKTEAREVIKLYTFSRILVLDRTGQPPLKDSPIVQFQQPDTFRSELATLLIQRLQGSGLAVGTADLESLARVIFDSIEPPYLEAIAHGLEKARQREDGVANPPSASAPS